MIRQSLAIFALAVLCLVAPFADPAAADTQGSASSRIIGRGDIVTSILLRSRSNKRTQTGGVAPLCKSHTFNDAEIEYLVAAIAHDPTATEGQSLLNLFRTHLLGPIDSSEPSNSEVSAEISAPVDFEIWARICDGFVIEARAIPRDTPSSIQAILGREMITRLPEPSPQQSPPAGISVPVNEPVFISMPDSSWQPVDTRLSAGGVVADVRAEPVAIRVFTGETNAEFQVCDGRGLPFDPRDLLSPAKQATRPGSCVVRYRQANRNDGSTLDKWLGTVTVLWEAEWRSNGGPWQSLGLIPRTRLIERHVREVTTVIGAARTNPSSRSAGRR